MKNLLSILLVSTCLLIGHNSMAVDESRLWLPKKYKAAKPKLIAAARRAENTKRCKKVIKGEMITRKNTPENYFFVLTCRDENDRTYNVSYLYPIEGSGTESEPQLIAEQSNNVKDVVIVKPSGVEQEQALKLCRNAVKERSTSMGGIRVQDEEIIDNSSLPGRYSYTLPFLAKVNTGRAISHLASCKVDKKGNVTLSTSLQSAGAIALCKQALLDEPLLLRNIEIQHDDVSSEERALFVVKVPFSATNLAKESRRFNAFCNVDKTGDVIEVITEIERQSLYGLCVDALNVAADKMIDVTIISEQVLNLTEEYGDFSGIIHFDARNQSGRKLHFQGVCDIDSSGRSSVSIEARTP